MNPQAVKSSESSSLYHITRNGDSTFCGHSVDNWTEAKPTEEHGLRECENCLGIIDWWLSETCVNPRNFWENLEFA